MGGPTDEADGVESSAVSGNTLLGLAVLNSADDVASSNSSDDETSASLRVCADAGSAAPAINFSGLKGEKLDELSMVLCGTVRGLEVIDSSDDVRNSSEDETCASCRVSADADSATAATSSDGGGGGCSGRDGESSVTTGDEARRVPRGRMVGPPCVTLSCGFRQSKK